MLATTFELQTPEIELWFGGAVAAGTLLLAIATGWLAWRTHEVAKKTGIVASETQRLAGETAALARRTAEDVESQFRPALVVDNDHERTTPVQYAMGTLILRVRNSGHGPALDIQALANPGGIAAGGWHRGAIPTDKAVSIEFSSIQPGEDQRIAVELEYRGLSDAQYITHISVNCTAAAIVDDVVVERLQMSESSDRAWLLN